MGCPCEKSPLKPQYFPWSGEWVFSVDEYLGRQKHIPFGLHRKQINCFIWGVPLGMYRGRQAALLLRINTCYMDFIQWTRLAVPLGIIPQIISPQINAGKLSVWWSSDRKTWWQIQSLVFELSLTRVAIDNLTIVYSLSQYRIFENTSLLFSQTFKRIF